MRVLVVCSYKRDLVGNIAPFIKEQMEALRNNGVDCECFMVQGKGIWGYLKNRKVLNDTVIRYQPEVIHAHYGLCGLLANLQRKVPVVTTYHGSDVNNPRVSRFSKMAIRLSAWNVFVSRKSMEVIHPEKRCSLIPCGVDLCDLQQTVKAEAKQRMGLSLDKRYVLFAGSFDNAVKDAQLAKRVVDHLDVELLELRGYSREEVTQLMCAADALLMTSKSEGSPQVIKEAMACGCPIVSVDVGDVRERTNGVEGCYVTTTRDPKELKEMLVKAMAFEGKTKGRDKIIADGLDNESIAGKLVEIYLKVKKS